MEDNRLTLNEALEAAYPRPYLYASYPANSLIRNDRVQVYVDEMSFLVDNVEETPNAGVRVTYSSGLVLDYPYDANVQVRV